MQTIRARRRVLLGLFIGLVGTTPVVAQDVDVPLYEGRWNARVQGIEGGYQSGQLVIRDYGGVWRDTSKSGSVPKACRGKSFPVTIQRTTATAFEFMVFGTSVAPVCPDLSVNITQFGAKLLEGSIGDTGKVRLERR